MRSAKAPAMSAGVMMANMSWDAMYAVAGLAGASAFGLAPTPASPTKSSPPMKRVLFAVLVSGLLAAAGWSANQATSNVAAMDAAATRACSELRQLGQDRGSLSPREVRDRVGQIYSDASASANPVIKARAVAL